MKSAAAALRDEMLSYDPCCDFRFDEAEREAEVGTLIEDHQKEVWIETATDIVSDLIKAGFTQAAGYVAGGFEVER